MQFNIISRMNKLGTVGDDCFALLYIVIHTGHVCDDTIGSLELLQFFNGPVNYGSMDLEKV